MTEQINTILDGLRVRAQQKGDHPAFIFRDKHGGRFVQTFQDVYQLGGRYAAILKARGVGRGQLVVNTLANCPERVVCEIGVLLSGAATVNGHCLLADGSDLLHTIQASQASAIIVDPDVSPGAWTVLQNHITLTEANDVTSDELPNLKKIFFVKRAPLSDQDFLTKLKTSSDWFSADDVKSDDICGVFTTSGSTGFSKLVTHTHRGLIQAVLRNNPLTDGMKENKVMEFSMAPLGWLGGHPTNTLLIGTGRVLCDTRVGLPEDLVDFILDAIEEEKVTHTFIPAPRLQPILEKLKLRRKEKGITFDPDNPGTALHILSRVLLGGQPITRSLVQTASLLARDVFVLYGTTEAFLGASFTVPDPHTYHDFDCGLPPKGGEVRIVSPKDETTLLPVGQTGMILMKRDAMMKNYYNNPEATSLAFTQDGFFRTGDLGRLDERGHVMVEGRGSDAIMKGPYIFYPGWLEERIRACPGVKDVMVVGVPDPGLNEEICACVTLKSDEVTVDQVQQFVEQDIVASDEEPLSPRPRHYVAFDAFPVTSTGKPHRVVVKRQASARLSSVSSDD